MVDLDTLAAISIRTYEQHYTHLWKDQGKAYMEAQFNLQQLKDHLLDNDHDLFLIKYPVEAIGLVHLHYNASVLDYPAKICLEIRKIYLLQEYTGKGIGSDVLQLIENLAATKDLKIMWLMAMDTGKARAFYEKNGYQVIEKKSLSHPKVKPHLKGMYLMVKTLGSV